MSTCNKNVLIGAWVVDAGVNDLQNFPRESRVAVRTGGEEKVKDTFAPKES